MELDAIWKYIDIDAPNGCWLWKGLLDSNFYGQIYLDDRKLMTKPHRLLYELYIGSYPYICRHKNSCPRNCCNPAHLSDGTPTDNRNDSPSLHSYPRRGTPEAKALHRQHDRERRRWHVLDSSIPFVKARAEDKLASQLLAYGDDCWNGDSGG